MLLELSIAPVLVLAIFYVYIIKRLQKHDNVLYDFCQLRRDVMTVMRRDNLQIDKENYMHLNDLLVVLNHNIHYYNEHKKTTFNIENYIKYLREIKKTSNKIEQKVKIVNGEIRQLYKNYGYVMFYAFFQYTPFIRSKVVFAILLLLYQAITKIVQGSSVKLVRALSYMIWLRGEANSYNIKLRYI